MKTSILILSLFLIYITSPAQLVTIYDKDGYTMVGLTDIHIDQVKVYRGRKMELFITATGADGSDGYEVAWCIKNNKLFTMTVLQTIP